MLWELQCDIGSHAADSFSPCFLHVSFFVSVHCKESSVWLEVSDFYCTISGTLSHPSHPLPSFFFFFPLSLPPSPPIPLLFLHEATIPCCLKLCACDRLSQSREHGASIVSNASIDAVNKANANGVICT